MKNASLCLAFALPLLALPSGCSLLSSQEIPYTADPQEISQDFGTQTGMLPETDCTAAPTLCMTITGGPAGATITCDPNPAAPGKNHCVLHQDITVHQTINLSQQTSFPSAVSSSPVVNLVQIDQIKYWTGPAQMLSVATPPLDIYIGSQTATGPNDPGVAQLGTIASIPAGMAPSGPPDCSGKTPATNSDTACSLALTEAGKSLFATLAKDFKTPFNIIVVGHLSVAGGSAFPSGKLDLFLQPVIGFHL
jgi:hypothetical protein